jgi:hypothetical protein
MIHTQERQMEERKKSGEIKSGRLAPASVEVNGKTRLGAVHATGKPSRLGIGPDLLCELLEPNRLSGRIPGQGNNTKSTETAGAGELLPVLCLRTREVNRCASKNQMAKALRQGKNQLLRLPPDVTGNKKNQVLTLSSAH